MIRFSNTLSGKVEEFVSIKPNEVSLYTCGPTVYNYAHIGNFRTFVFEDLLRRFLEFKGFTVKHVMNITDVDDKTIAGSNRENKTLGEYTSFYTDAFLFDMKTLKNLRPVVQPRATESIPDMINMISALMEKGIAYKAEDGSVYYRVSEFNGYGKLSKKKLEGNISGARVAQDDYEKEEGADFVLWKAAKEGEPFWASPWGNGRPGWHIECSAMSCRHLGETIDIHAGGEDLVFPHHENEIAQSEAANGKPFVRYWLHAKHLLVNGEKMSKSKGNFWTLRDILGKGYDPIAIRYALLSVHYQHQLNFTFDSLKEAKDVIEKMDNCYFQLLSREQLAKEQQQGFDESILSEAINEIEKALDENLNIALALATLQETVTKINAGILQMSKSSLRLAMDFFQKTDKLFGFDIASIKEIPSETQNAIAAYSEARAAKDFAKSDALRNDIAGKGWLVKDGKPGEISTVKKIRRTWDAKKDARR